MQVPVWVRDTAERAAWTFVAAFIAAAGFSAGSHIEDIHWVAALNIALVATVFSTLKSAVVSHIPVGQPGTASAISLTP